MEISVKDHRGSTAEQAEYGNVDYGALHYPSEVNSSRNDIHFDTLKSTPKFYSENHSRPHSSGPANYIFRAL
jgi:hypothetical protein